MSAAPDIRAIGYQKAGHRYLLIYDHASVQQRADLMRKLCDFARDDRLNLDWYDVGKLSAEVCRPAAGEKVNRFALAIEPLPANPLLVGVATHSAKQFLAFLLRLGFRPSEVDVYAKKVHAAVERLKREATK